MKRFARILKWTREQLKLFQRAILFVLCIGFMFAGCNKSQIESCSKYNCNADEELKIKTFFERVDYDEDYGLDARVNKWIANNKNMIEIIDIQINGLYHYGSSNEYSVIMITYKELSKEIVK